MDVFAIGVFQIGNGSLVKRKCATANTAVSCLSVFRLFQLYHIALRDLAHSRLTCRRVIQCFHPRPFQKSAESSPDYLACSVTVADLVMICSSAASEHSESSLRLPGHADGRAQLLQRRSDPQRDQREHWMVRHSRDYVFMQKILGAKRCS